MTRQVKKKSGDTHICIKYAQYWLSHTHTHTEDGTKIMILKIDQLLDNKKGKEIFFLIFIISLGNNFDSRLKMSSYNLNCV